MYIAIYVLATRHENVYIKINVIFVQINDNGIISFNNTYNVRTPLSLPLSGTQQIIAPYWADVDTNGTGQILYRQSTDPSLLARATKEIREAFPSSEILMITNLLIATWVDVGYYYQKIDKVSFALCSILCMQIHTCTCKLCTYA